MSEVSVYEARNNLSRSFKEAQSGREITITSRGAPVARLVLVVAHAGRDILSGLETNPLPSDQRRTAVEIETAIIAEREKWE